jgi:hypothetical protein
MSLINILEQMGSNSSFRRLSTEDLSVALKLSTVEAMQLKSAQAATPEQLAALFQAQQHHCIVQVFPADEEDEEGEEEQKQQDKSIRTNNIH